MAGLIVKPALQKLYSSCLRKNMVGTVTWFFKKQQFKTVTEFSIRDINEEQ